MDDKLTSDGVVALSGGIRGWWSVKRAADSGELPAERIGRRIFIPRAAAEAWLTPRPVAPRTSDLTSPRPAA